MPKQLLTDAVALLESYRLLFAGGACYWCGFCLTLWSNPLVSQGYASTGKTLFWVFITCSPILVLAILTFVSFRREHAFATNLGLYFLGAGLSLCGFLLLRSTSDAPLVPQLFGALCLGLGSGVGQALIAVLHIGLGPSKLLALAAMEMVLASICYFLLSLLPAELSLMFACLATIAAFCLFSLYTNQRAFSNTVAPAPRENRRADMSITSLVLLALLVGISYGITKNFLAHTVPTFVANSGSFETLGMLMAGLLLLPFARILKERSFFEQSFILVVPLVCLGVLTIPLFSLNSYAPILINSVGGICFLLFIWMISAHLRQEATKLNPTFCLTLLLASLMFGQTLGSVLPVELVNIYSSFIVFILIVFLVLNYIRMFKRAQKALSSRDTEKERLSAAAKSIALTPRECEVFLMLMQRTPYKQIEDELCISANTVKTHVNNIYHKAGVTSREDLLAWTNRLCSSDTDGTSPSLQEKRLP